MDLVSTAPSVIQPALLSRMNERQVLRAIQAHGPLSRAEVARCAGISAPTASKAVESLLRSGWLEEGSAPELMRGRPARKLHLPGRTTQVLGFVIDADLCRVVSAGLDGSIRDESHSFPTPDAYSDLLAIGAHHARLLMDRPGVRTLGMGISMPGLIDCRQQRGILSPNVPITNGHAPGRDFAELLDLECILIQESHALCLAERYYGSARGLDNFAMLDATSGVGLGVMSGGQLLTGARGLAGEIGHIAVMPDGRVCGCGNCGCLETVACDTAAAWELSQRIGRKVSVSEMVSMLRAGDASSGATEAQALEEALQSMMEFMAIGVGAVVNLFNPSTLFVHSRVFRAREALFDEMLRAAARRALRPSLADCTIVQARGSKRLGAIAATIEHLLDGLVPLPMKGSHDLGGIRHTMPARSPGRRPRAEELPL